VKWSEEEIEEVKTYFHECLTTKTTPNMKKCFMVIEKSRAAGGKIHLRSWATLKKKCGI
jgi:hypothetical protein